MKNISGILATAAVILSAITGRAQATAETSTVPAAADTAVVLTADTVVCLTEESVFPEITLESLSAAFSLTKADSVTPPPGLLPVPVLTPDRWKNAARQSIYDMPYSLTGSCHDWHRLWINTGVLGGAFVGTLMVLECLPEDATSWNRAALQKVPLFKRWRNHVLREGPEWDHDKFMFNYVLHPYAGAAYFMGARSCGFNFYQSLLYASIISNIGWEFGIEAFMERPSYQDLFITPLVGSAVGECFYRVKRHIVDNGYELAGSSFLGGLVCFIVDPINEVIGLFAGNPARKAAAIHRKPHASQASVTLVPTPTSLSLRITF